MEKIVTCDQELFEEAMIEFVLTPLPVALSLDDVNYVYQVVNNGNQASSKENGIPPSPPSLNNPNHQNSDDFAKKEIRRQKDRIRRRKTILRRRCEREALNWEIKELSKQVDELKCKAEDNVDASAWKATASRQIRAVQALTDERRFLREEVRKRAGLIHEMRHLFRDQLDALPTTKFNGEASERSNNTNSMLFKQFLWELVTAYKQTNDIFRTCAMESHPQSSVIKTTREKQGDTEFFQSRGKQLMPFEYRQTCHYLWQLVVLAHRQEDRQLYCEVEDTENTVAIKFRCFDQGQTAPLMVHYVIRRYQENERIVMVWRSFNEGEGVFSGMNSDETGWCIVYPSTLASCTVMETCTRVVPMHLDSTTPFVSLKDQFTSIVLKSSEEDILHISMKLDRLLLDEALEHVVVEGEAS